MVQILEGRFSYDTKVKELSFICVTKNVSFEEVKEALVKLRDEVDRQIKEQEKCPHYGEEV